MHVRPYTMFSTLHPTVLLFYALGGPFLTMISQNPLILGTSVVCAWAVHGFYLGGRSTAEGIRAVLLLFLLIVGFNFLTNPRGQIVLIQAESRAYTMESLCYGISNGVMLCAVIFWFRCFTAVLPNHKFLYLFGRRFQTVALLLSMILKLFPETHYKICCIRMAQGTEEIRGNGSREKERIRSRLSQGMRQISCLLEWSMEDSIETADSMRARGYGEGKRTHYDRYRFTSYDAGTMLLMGGMFLVVLTGLLLGKTGFSYYPTFSWNHGGKGWQLISALCELVFLLMPVWMEWRGGMRR